MKKNGYLLIFLIILFTFGCLSSNKASEVPSKIIPEVKNKLLPEVTSKNAPDNSGIYLKEENNYKEISEFLGQPGITYKDFTSSKNTNPIIFISIPNIEFNYLELRNLDNMDLISYEIKQLTNSNSYELSINKKLNDGVYCLIQGDPLKSPVEISYWCFRVGEIKVPTETPNPIKSEALTPEQIAAQNFFNKAFSKELKENLYRNIEFETLSNDGQIAQIKIIYEYFTDEYEDWFPGYYIFNIKLIAGNWIVDESNYEADFSPEARATMASIDEMEAQNYAFTQTEEARLRKDNFGGTYVKAHDCDDGIVCFNVVDEFGNSKIISPELPPEYLNPDLYNFTISRYDRRIYLFIKYLSKSEFVFYTVIFSSDLDGNNIKEIWNEKNSTSYIKSFPHRMDISPDGQMIAMNIESGKKLVILYVNSGEVKVFLEDDDKDIAAFTWANNSQELYIISNSKNTNNKYFPLLRKIDITKPVDDPDDPYIVTVFPLNFEHYFSPWSSIILMPNNEDIIINRYGKNPKLDEMIMVNIEDESIFSFKQGAYCHLKLSNDGNRLIYMAIGESNFDGEIYSLNLTTGEEYFVTEYSIINRSEMRCISGYFGWIDD